MRKPIGYTLHRFDVSGDAPRADYWQAGAWVPMDDPAVIPATPAEVGEVFPPEPAHALHARLTAECRERQAVLMWPVYGPEPEVEPPAEEPHLSYSQRNFTPAQSFEDLERRHLA